MVTSRMAELAELDIETPADVYDELLMEEHIAEPRVRVRSRFTAAGQAVGIGIEPSIVRRPMAETRTVIARAREEAAARAS